MAGLVAVGEVRDRGDRGREEYYDARSVFHAFLTVVDLDDPVLRAVALTAIDDGSIGILRDRAAKGDAGAREVLDDIIDFLGEPLRGVTSRREGESGQDAPPRRELATPDPERYPPPQVTEYLAVAEPSYLAHVEECLRAWLAYWRGRGEGLAAYDAAVALVRSGREVRIADVLFELAMQFHGKREAYPWLAAAQRESGGWSRFFTSEEDAMRRWEAIRRWYPERWLEFVSESVPRGRGEIWEGISARDKVFRLVKYCLLMGQVDLAERIAEQVIESTLALVCASTLAVPAWATQD
jgi:hypothetical protein